MDLTYEESLLYLVKGCRTLREVRERLGYLYSYCDPDDFSFVRREQEVIEELFQRDIGGIGELVQRGMMECLRERMISLQ